MGYQMRGLRAWYLKRSMRDPVLGTFHVVDDYFPSPGRVPMRVMLTGFVQADGVPRTVAETLDNFNHDHTAIPALPALVDRSDPARFLVHLGPGAQT